MPLAFASQNRDGLEVRDGVPVLHLRALDKFQGHGVVCSSSFPTKFRLKQPLEIKLRCRLLVLVDNFL